MLHDYLSRRGVRDVTTIHLVTPMPKPIPISDETSDALVGLLDERDIRHSHASWVTRLDPAAKVAHLKDGRQMPFDLFLAVPVHRAPPVVVDSGLTEDGWIPVDPATFATRFPDVYAVGDVTSAPVPRAGVIAEGEASTVADVLVARIAGGPPPAPYPGEGICYIEMGDDTIGTVDVNFLSGPAPTALFTPPSAEAADDKRRFAAVRRDRWFGPGPRASRPIARLDGAGPRAAEVAEERPRCAWSMMPSGWPGPSPGGVPQPALLAEHLPATSSRASRANTSAASAASRSMACGPCTSASAQLADRATCRTAPPAQAFTKFVTYDCRKVRTLPDRAAARSACPRDPRLSPRPRGRRRGRPARCRRTSRRRRRSRRTRGPARSSTRWSAPARRRPATRPPRTPGSTGVRRAGAVRHPRETSPARRRRRP